MNPGESSENHRFRERAEAAKIRAVILDYGEVLCHHPTAEEISGESANGKESHPPTQEEKASRLDAPRVAHE